MDRRARRRLIILGILAGVLLALFVVSVVYRGDDRGPGSGCSSSRREAWRARLLPSEPVVPGQLGGCTPVLGTFSISGGCELKIAAAEPRSRRLVVVAVDPVEIRRITDADGRRIAMRAELEPGKRTQIFVGRAGESIALRCLAAIICRARLE